MTINEYPFTEAAVKALEAAKHRAAADGSAYIGTEHILLGLVAVSGIVSETLKSVGITPEKIQNTYESLFVFSQNPVRGRKPEPKWSPRSVEIWDIAYDEAKNGGMEKIGTEHLMVAILLQDDSAAMRILLALNLPEDRFVNELYTAMGEEGLTYLNALNRQPEDYENAHYIERFSRNLTQLAALGKSDPVIGREKELSRLIRTLSRRTKNNPCLIGEPGVGKTAMVERLAAEIAKGNVPDTLKNKRIYALDMAGMVAGTKFRGEFEERIEGVISEAAADGNILLFLDEIHTIIGAGGAEGALDAANILKPALSRGEIQIIGATTTAEYRKHIEKDSALERRFQPIVIEEPSEEETVAILSGLKSKYEKHHGLTISDEALTAAAFMSARYINDRFLPDKALDLIDEASAKAKLSTGKKKKEIILGEADIASVISDMTGIPASRLTETESSRLMKLEKELHRRIISQDEAVSAVARAVRRGRAGLKDPRRPIGSFLFLGPTGVGKTELAKALAEALFGRDDAMVRVDMSEYMESHSVSKLIGSPPGYVGYDEGGQLSEKVRRNPYCVLLFDEIEKAHPDIFHVLLQILDDGHITDAQGRKIDFKNTIIIMTSNVGAQRIVEPKKLGFNTDTSAESDYLKMKDGVMEEVKKLFRPELLNRIDEILVFRQLGREDVGAILDNQLADLQKRTQAGLGISFGLTASAKDYLVTKDYDPKYGARPLRRAIQTELEDLLAQEALGGNIKSGETVTVTLDKKTGRLSIKARAAR